MGYVVIYDTVAWTTGSLRNQDLVYHTLSRGDAVPDDVPKDKLAQWLDDKVSPPHGAVAEEGTELARLGTAGASVAQDPAEARRLFAEAAGASTAPLDPAREPADEAKSTTDPGVAASRAAAGRGTGTAVIAPPPHGGEAPKLDLDAMSKTQLQAMADGLGVEYAKADTNDELRDKIRAHMGGSDGSHDDQA